MKLERSITQLEAENLELKEALLDVVNQACQVEFVNGKCILDDSALSAYESTLALLERLGLARRLQGRRWELIWPKQAKAPEL